MDTERNVLWYAQHPLVYTEMGKNTISGCNPIVAYMPGATEDGLIFNQGSIDRGMFRATSFKTLREQVCIGEDIKSIVAPGEIVQKNQPFMVKSKLIYKFRKKGKRNVSETKDVKIKSKFSGKVHKTMIYEAADGSTGVKVQLRVDRIPTVGDKFASRFAQKGVISRIVKQEDMIYTKDGISPDIIFNPHSIPSRMTLGHVAETECAKLSALRGRRMDRTSATDRVPTTQEIIQEMKDMGFNYKGTEAMYCGKTGKKLKVPIFIGSNYYRRLNHNSMDKIWGRARGRRNISNRQPNTGRSNGGAFRVGEMEKDCIQNWGSAMVLRDRLLINSDAFKIDICKKCGCFHLVKNKCLSCKSKQTKTITVPYPFYMLLNELFSVNINVRMIN